MNVLVLGGTVFLGRHLVAALVANGHRVTTFNRGTHREVEAELPVTRIAGDRTQPAELERIPPDGWDAVVDLSSDIPDDVEAAARRLRSAGRYVYISSISAYDLSRAPLDEGSRVVDAYDGDPAALTAEAFGWRKATSEARVAAVFGRRATRIRPGLLAGPYDPTDRFTYWPVRIARGGDVLVPGPPEREVQFIDVRDVAGFIVHAIERDFDGIYNVTSPLGAVRMRDVIAACTAGAAAAPVFHWVDGAFLTEHGCAGWSDLPLWIRADARYPGIFAADVSRAVAAGLRLRAIEETAQAVRDWYARTGRTSLAAGLDAGREMELLEIWNAAISS
jgi:2'-hydroxyisoflavone reductase